MAQFQVTQRIRNELDKVLSLNNNSYNLKRLQRFKNVNAADSTQISLSELNILSEILRSEFGSNGTSGFWVHELIEGSEAIKPKSLEEMTGKEKMLASARLIQESKEYERITHNIRRDKIKWESSSENVKEYRFLNQQVLVYINVIISGIVSFAGGYFVFSRTYKDTLTAIFAGIVCGLVVVIAEVWLLYLQYSRSKSIKTKIRKSKSVSSSSSISNSPQVVETFIVSNSNAPLSMQSLENSSTANDVLTKSLSSKKED